MNIFSLVFMYMDTVFFNKKIGMMMIQNFFVLCQIFWTYSHELIAFCVKIGISDIATSMEPGWGDTSPQKLVNTK